MRLAYEALRTGRGATTVFNAANEVAVAAFIAGQIKFGSIARLVEATINDWIRAGNLAPLSSADDAPGINNWPDILNNHGEKGINGGFLDGHVSWLATGRPILEAYMDSYYVPNVPTNIYQKYGLQQNGNVFRWIK